MVEQKQAILHKKFPQSFNKVSLLLSYLNLSQEQVNYDGAAEQQFSFLVPRSFVDRMEKGNPNDPLLLQVLPQVNESTEYEGFVTDPLNEKNVINTQGILQKYQHRLLLMPTSACGIHCRYCFRRHFPYLDNAIDKDNLTSQLNTINQNKKITEIILSGGDPLTLSNDKLAYIFEQLHKIKHLKRIRIHTRQLIVSPDRIDKSLISILSQSILPIAIVLHCNHSNEISNDIGKKIQRLKLPSIQLLNQSVLLKQINDSAETLISLSEKLYENGILPYYLHQLDQVAGSQHFFVEKKVALELHDQMKVELPGYLVPKLVKESANTAYKETLV